MILIHIQHCYNIGQQVKVTFRVLHCLLILKTLSRRLKEIEKKFNFQKQITYYKRGTKKFKLIEEGKSVGLKKTPLSGSCFRK